MNTLFIVGAAGAALYLSDRASTDCSAKVQRDGREAGNANSTAAAELRKRLASSSLPFRFDVPASASMACAWRAMRAAIGSRTLTLRQLEDVCNLWLNVYDAGYNASGSGVGSSLYGSSKVNYSMLEQTRDGSPTPGIARPYNYGDPPCSGEWSAHLSKLGQRVCALIQWRDGIRQRMTFGVVAYNDQREVLARTEAVADAMDAADFLPPGERNSDRNKMGIGEFVGSLLGDVLSGVVSPATIAVVAIGAIVAVKVIKS